MAWIGALDPRGYGRFNFGGTPARTGFAHRWAYEHLRGEVPEGLELDHLCSNPRCVNPWHLEPVTHTVNVQRGRAPAATRAYYAKWTCKSGHRVEGANAYLSMTPTGHTRKQCRICNAAKQRRYQQRKKEMATP